MDKIKLFIKFLKVIPALVFIGFLIPLMSNYSNTSYDIRIYLSLFSAIIILILLFVNQVYFAVFTEIVFLTGTFMGLLITSVTNSTRYGLIIFGIDLAITIQPLFLFLLLAHTILNFESVKTAFKYLKKFYNGE